MPVVVLYAGDGGGFVQAGQTLPNVEGFTLSWWTPEMTIIGRLSLMAWGLGYFGQPHINVRFMAVRTVKEVPDGAWMPGQWQPRRPGISALFRDRTGLAQGLGGGAGWLSASSLGPPEDRAASTQATSSAGLSGGLQRRSYGPGISLHLRLDSN